MSQSEEDPSESSQGFRIEDRRRFSETGERREGVEDEPEPQRPASRDAGTERSPAEASRSPGAGGQPAQADEAAGGHRSAEGESAAGPINFSSFVVGLATQAIMFMGLAPDPGTGMVHRDLPQAKGLIDILAMLRDKTRGNLDEEEDTMMEEMLYELRMQYVRILRGDTEPPQSGENG
jgi:hypothetical protein